MAIRVLMPALSPTMTEGNIARWLKQEGEAVSAGDVLAEIETDKATMEIEAIDEGVLGKIVTPDGAQAIPVNAVIGVILEEGEDSSALEALDLAPPPVAAPAAPPAAAAPPPPAAQAAVPAASPPPATAAPAAAIQVTAPADGGRIFASPLARRMAEQAGLDLAALRGTGPKGRIVKVDIEAAMAAAPAAAAPALSPAPASAPAVPGASYVDAPVSNMRRIIAQRLQLSKQTIPHFYLTIDCEIDALLEIRKELNGRADDYKLSVNDFVVRAAALGLRKVPAVNASWLDNVIRQYNTVDVSVAVAIEDGLVTPIIRNADHKGLVEISTEMKALSERARATPMALKPEEYQGGGFCISNLGMYGIKEFAAVINPPQAMILAVGAGAQRPIVKDGALAIATVMSCTLSVDHRVVDGASGAAFLGIFKGLIEDPLTMLL